MREGRSRFRIGFDSLLACAVLVSVQNVDLYWLILETGIILAVLARRSSFDMADDPSMQRPLTLFMVLPLSMYVLLSFISGDGAIHFTLLMLNRMMATLLMSLLAVMALVRRTSIRLNSRFILSFSTILAVSWASLYATVSVTMRLGLGEAVSNEAFMWELLGIVFFSLLSGSLLKRDVRRMDQRETMLSSEAWTR